MSKHLNAHTNVEIQHISNLLKRNPNITISKLYGKLRKIIDILDTLLLYLYI